MIRIALTGPESSGKTTLGRALANDLNGVFIPEFARNYLTDLKRAYELEDLTAIAQGHLASFIHLTSPLLLIDSDFIVLKIWSKEKYGHVPTSIENLLSTNYFDLHILCSPDIPWEPDVLRENPDDRDRLYRLYEEELIRTNKPFISVSGSLQERLKKSSSAIINLSK